MTIEQAAPVAITGPIILVPYISLQLFWNSGTRRFDHDCMYCADEATLKNIGTQIAWIDEAVTQIKPKRNISYLCIVEHTIFGFDISGPFY